MIKKIILIFSICCFLVACGKKGDPEYKDPDRKVETKIILTSKV